MRKILIIGIDAGAPELVTMQAVKALDAVDVFFILARSAAAVPKIAPYDL